jgi:hypothetical protein
MAAQLKQFNFESTLNAPESFCIYLCDNVYSKKLMSKP